MHLVRKGHLFLIYTEKQSTGVFFVSPTRYAIGFAERSGPKAHIGWLASLANATDQPYLANNTGGPTIKVKKALQNFNHPWDKEKCNMRQKILILISEKKA